MRWSAFDNQGRLTDERSYIEQCQKYRWHFLSEIVTVKGPNFHMLFGWETIGPGVDKKPWYVRKLRQQGLLWNCLTEPTADGKENGCGDKTESCTKATSRKECWACLIPSDNACTLKRALQAHSASLWLWNRYQRNRLCVAEWVIWSFCFVHKTKPFKLNLRPSVTT